MGDEKSEAMPLTSSVTEGDRKDLLAILEMRFGPMSWAVRERIEAIDDVSQIDHLILVAANAKGWKEFATEADAPGFRIVGQDFDPLGDDQTTHERKKGPHVE